jgi:hypothetical protein
VRTAFGLFIRRFIVLRTLCLLCGGLLVLVTTAAPAAADTITWFASNEVTGIMTPSNALATLTIGTPWSLAINFDADAPAHNIRGISGCNQYPVASSALTLGPYTYNSSGGLILTQHGFPASACDAPVSLEGLLQFVIPVGTSADAGAWPLASSSLLINFFNAPPDGSLPTTPPSLASIYLWGGDIYWRNLGPVQFQAVVDEPAPVPEPATLTMLGAGLAALIAHRRRVQ